MQGKLRMDAYYYGFTETGDRSLDRILSAVACAGKAYHHTDRWNDSGYTPEGHEGDTPVDWIQNAAEVAKADHLTEIAKKEEEHAEFITDLVKAHMESLDALQSTLRTEAAVLQRAEARIREFEERDKSVICVCESLESARKRIKELEGRLTGIA